MLGKLFSCPCNVKSIIFVKICEYIYAHITDKMHLYPISKIINFVLKFCIINKV